jgi:hypothetical protein
MEHHMRMVRSLILLLAVLALAVPADAQVSKPMLDAVSTPNTVETRIGTLDFKDGMPSQETVAKVYDHLDFTHAFEAFVNSGVNRTKVRKVSQLFKCHI